MTVSSTYVAADGDGYELQMGRWSRRLAQPFLDFAGLMDGEEILDVGCGTGSLTREIASRTNAARVYGVDYSHAYIEYSKRQNQDPRLEFLRGDACALPFPHHSFDRVLSLLMLHFVPQAKLAIAEMRRVARSGSTIAAAVWDARGGFVANRIFFDTAAMLDPEAVTRRAKNFTRPMTRPGELAAAWRDGGLEDVQEAQHTIRMEYASFDDYWTPLTARDGPIADYVKALSAERRDELRDAVRLAFLDGEPDGVRSYAATAWAVKGQAP
jgi:SAM-dependent methyltransferase